MKRNIICVLLVILLLPTTVWAQRKKRKTSNRPKVEAPVENPKYTRMLAATAQVVVIDSMIVKKAVLFDAIHVNREEGTIDTYAHLFNTEGEGNAYVNELGTKCIYSHFDENGHKKLYQRNLIGGKWSKSEQLKGLDADGMLTDFDYPYLMPDGTTLYFAAKGEESLGGFDIYRTRYDADEDVFLKPENLGMPFNSEADDFMFIIDEQNQLGYFATNRRLNGDTLCVYTFVPFETRKTIVAEAYSPEALRSIADLKCIADTWGDGAAKKKATNRLRQVLANNTNTPSSQSRNDFEFVINDEKTYFSYSNFNYPDNRKRMKELLDLKAQAKTLEASLQKARDYYATAAKSEQQRLKTEILNGEHQQQQLLQAIRKLEKTIRNTENL